MLTLVLERRDSEALLAMQAAGAHWRHARAQAQALEQTAYVLWVDRRMHASRADKQSVSSTGV